jgi:hypothetical protein
MTIEVEISLNISNNFLNTLKHISETFFNWSCCLGCVQEIALYNYGYVPTQLCNHLGGDSSD